MATTISISHFAPLTILYLLLLSTHYFSGLAINITDLLTSYSDLSDFANLLSSTAVAGDISGRTSVTILAVPNPLLRRSSDLLTSLGASSSYAGDVIRYHVLLEYLSWPELRRVPAAGKTVTTLFQTTGRAKSEFGSVNITRDPISGDITVASPATNATVIEQIKNLPYNVSVFSISTLLLPYGFESDPNPNPPPPPLVNINRALIAAENFNVAAAMLSASGVEAEFEQDEGGAGLTLFVPTDLAFSDLPSSIKFQSLPAEKKAIVLRFHVLHSYYPLGSLESIVNPLQPTLATEQSGAGSFTLNISRVNGSVAISTGIVHATVIRTVIDENPVAIFGISKVLLPKELFPENSIEVNKSSSAAGGGFSGGVAPPPEISPPPDNYHLSSPAGENMSSSAGNGVGAVRVLLGFWCIVYVRLLLWQ